MMLRPPRFWNEDKDQPSLITRALSPMGSLYGRIVEGKLSAAVPIRVTCPIVCVGNVTMGGVGKTPFVGVLTDYLSSQQRQTHILMRGYGGRVQGPLRVSTNDLADDVGDEALMLAQRWPVWVSKDRPEGAQAAAAAGADVIVMDDGFQNPSLHKDISFLLIDGETGLGNGRVFPAGPLREHALNAFRRTDAVVIVGGQMETPHKDWNVPEALPILNAVIRSDISALPPAQPVIAFAGIGRPGKFFDGLKQQKIAVLSEHSYPDHHPYTVDDLHDLKKRAAAYEAALVTTEKDFMRLHPDQREGITPVPGKMIIEQMDLLSRLLTPIIAGSGGSHGSL